MASERKWAIVPQGTHWRAKLAEHKAAWTDRNLDEIHEAIEDDVYIRALNAQKMSSIARSYGVPRSDFELVYGDVWRLGNSEMQSIIAQDTLKNGLTSKIPVAKIWMGKALGGLGESSNVHAETDVAEDGAVQINVNMIRNRPLEDEAD